MRRSSIRILIREESPGPPPGAEPGKLYAVKPNTAIYIENPFGAAAQIGLGLAIGAGIGLWLVNSFLRAMTWIFG